MSVAIATPDVARAQDAPRPRTIEAVPDGELADLSTLAGAWQRALDAAQRALSASERSFPPAELADRRRSLALERRSTENELARLARLHARPLPWLSPVPVTSRMLGLPETARACLFDLDGVLTDSGALHAWAWGEVFDELLLRLTEKTGWQFIPFDRGADYRDFIDGRQRLEGVHAFLDSRGIRLPEGRPGDPSNADTAQGLARRKGETLVRGLSHRGVTALAGARRYLEAAGYAGLGRAVISASASTLPMLELAGLASLVDERIDAEVIRIERVQSRPAPDLLLVACRRLGVAPEAAVTLTHSAAGVAAGHAAGTSVIGVGAGADAAVLHGFGADRIVASVNELLDRQLREPADP
jgi:HAD superfamily hydrolase (TIGR01509 family)